MSGFKLRFITALFFVFAVAVGATYSLYTLLLLFLTINFVTIWEYQQLTHSFAKSDVQHVGEENTLLAVISSITYLILAGVVTKLYPPQYIGFLLFIPPLLGIKELLTNSQQAFLRFALNITGLIYISLPLALFVGISTYDGAFSGRRILGLLFLIWVSDTAAYLIGRSIGRTPLFPRVSPNKTWEGTVAGILGALSIVPLQTKLVGGFSLWEWTQLAVVVIIFSILGDLMESVLKRNVDSKDSGSLLPGHGGFLDRFDSMLFTAPFVYAYLILVIR